MIDMLILLGCRFYVDSLSDGGGLGVVFGFGIFGPFNKGPSKKNLYRLHLRFIHPGCVPPPRNSKLFSRRRALPGRRIEAQINDFLSGRTLSDLVIACRMSLVVFGFGIFGSFNGESDKE